MLSLSIYVMSDARYVRHNILLLRLAVPVKIGAVFFYVVDVLLYQRDIMVVGRMGRSEKRGKI